MVSRHPTLPRQRGAVAIITGLLLLLVLCTAGALVIDLGRLYIVKSELQNIADAVALAAAKDLNNSPEGVQAAYEAGIAIAGANKYDLNSSLTLTQANFRFGESPDGPWYSYSDSYNHPAARTFVEVDTRVGGSGGTSQSVGTYLMRIVDSARWSNMSTYGYAVAGRYVNAVAPIGICAIDPTHRTASYNYGTFTELVEFGFRRGMSYNVFELGSLAGASSDPYLINPVNSPPNECVAANSSATNTAPFVCTGKSAVLPLGSGQVYANTGISGGQIVNALNSRFDEFPNGSQCSPTSHPPDINIQDYACKKGGSECVPNNSNTPATTPPIEWMEPGGNTYPSRQTMENWELNGLKSPKYALPHEVDDTTKVYPSQPYHRNVDGASVVGQLGDFAAHGPLWAYGPPVQADGTTVITVDQANGTLTSGTNMYGAAGGNYFSSTYPALGPYSDTTPANFRPPDVNTGSKDRRILNLVLINCAIPQVGSGACGTMTAVGIGKFFMLRPADFSGSPKKLFVEFTGLVEPVPTAEVKLYK